MSLEQAMTKFMKRKKTEDVTEGNDWSNKAAEGPEPREKKWRGKRDREDKDIFEAECRVTENLLPLLSVMKYRRPSKCKSDAVCPMQEETSQSVSKRPTRSVVQALIHGTVWLAGPDGTVQGAET